MAKTLAGRDLLTGKNNHNIFQLINNCALKTKLLIFAMLLLPLMFGCSKDEGKMIVGDWYQCYYESFYDSEKIVYEYTKEHLNILIYLRKMESSQRVAKMMKQLQVVHIVLKKTNCHNNMKTDILKQ